MLGLSRHDCPSSLGSCARATSRSHTERVINAARIALTLATVLGAVPRAAHAQGYPGGGMGGGGGRRGGMGGPPGGASGQRGPMGVDIAKQIEGMASLKDALHKVPDLSDQQKDSAKALERRYGDVFKSYGIAAKNMMDSARTGGGMPDMDAMRTIREQADSVRSAELITARALLTTDAQRSRFDQNVADLSAEQAKHEEQMRQRRSRGGMGGGMGGGMRPPE
jgi:hypothetical protein